jgi:antitoxin ParD1/3/4
MPNVSLGEHFEEFIDRQIAQGRFQNASEVVRAGLRLLEDTELSRAERAAKLAREINEAFDAKGANIPCDDVFARLEQQYATANEAVREAIREWGLKCELQQEDIKHLRRLWTEGLGSGSAGDVDLVALKAEARGG